VRDSGLDKVLKGLIAARLSVGFCEEMLRMEAMALELGYEDIAEDIKEAHHHGHNAIRHATDGDEEINEAINGELEMSRKMWDKFIDNEKARF